MRVLLIGDIFGRPGRDIVRKLLPDYRKANGIDLAIANGENASAGRGCTAENFHEILASGVDVVTMGDHIWDKKELLDVIDKTDFLVRPANYPDTAPGRGATIVQINRKPVAIMNLQGRVFMQPPLDCPFRKADALLPKLREQTPLIFVDFHAEATSEKVAMGWYLDGRVTAVVGTHTHVPTDDVQVLPNGTGFVTDLGITGPVDSVIGMNKDDVLKRFLEAVFVPFTIPKTGRVHLNAVLVDADETTGKARAISRVRLEALAESL